jgi:hypothetical protein
MSASTTRQPIKAILLLWGASADDPKSSEAGLILAVRNSAYFRKRTPSPEFSPFAKKLDAKLILEDALQRLQDFQATRIHAIVKAVMVGEPTQSEASGVRVTGPQHRDTHYRRSPVFLSEGSLTREAAS